MKRTSSILIVILMFSIFFSVFAQEKGAEKITQNGKEFYIYHVQEKESLYRISKEFEIPQEEIIQYNQQAIGGVKKGMSLKIPVTSLRRNAPSQTQTKKNDGNANFIVHKVEKGQTIYFITKKYNISQATLAQYNPSIETGLRVGEELQIPQFEKSNQSEKAVIFSVPGYIEHEVMPKETLYGISKMYNVTTDEIKRLNPEIEQGLKSGQKLKIPTNKPIKAKELPTTTAPKMVVTPSSVSKEKDETQKAVEQTTSPISENTQPIKTEPLTVISKTEHSSSDKIVRISLLLPFMLNEPEKQDATIDKFIEFYNGILVGLNELKENGYSVELNTYDIEKSEAKAKTVLATNSTIKKSDLIIGPAYTAQVNAVANFAKANKIPLVVPFSHRIDEIKNNPYLFQFNSSFTPKFNAASHLFINHFKDKNIVILTFNNNINDEGSEFAKYLEIKLKRNNISFKKLAFNQSNFASVEQLMSNQKENIVLLATEEETLVKDLLPKINSYNSEETSVSVYGFVGWGKSLELCNSSYYYTPFYVDGDKERHAAYNNIYRKEFGYPGTKKPRFDLIGHDLTVYFVKNISKYGKEFKPIKNTIDIQLQSKFQFDKQGANGGYINSGVFLLNYTQNGYKLIE